MEEFSKLEEERRNGRLPGPVRGPGIAATLVSTAAAESLKLFVFLFEGFVSIRMSLERAEGCQE